MSSSEPDAVLYAKLLKCKGMGHALWYPGPNDNLAQQTYKDTGMRIGDLGIIRRNGTFDFLWNLAAPEDDPVNVHEPPQPPLVLPQSQIFPVPDKTSYINESEETVSQYAEVEKGLTATAPSVAPGATEVRESVFKLKTYQSKAAFLHLPHGSEMTDLADLGAAEKFLREHANMLFSYATKDRGRQREPHGEPLQVTVVTGYHKTTHWGMMVLNRKTRLASGALSVEFPLPPAQVNATASYGFSSSVGNFPGATSMRRGPDKPGPRNQSVFIRGFHMMRRPFRSLGYTLYSIEDTNLLDVQVGKLTEPLHVDPFPEDPFGNSTFPNTSSQSHDDDASASMTTSHVLAVIDTIVQDLHARAANKPGTSFTLNDLISTSSPSGTEEAYPDVIKERPRSVLIYQDGRTSKASKIAKEYWHPTALINETICEWTDPDVAITHDNVWLSVIKPEESHVSNAEILARVKRRYTPIFEVIGGTKVAWMEENASVTARQNELRRARALKYKERRNLLKGVESEEEIRLRQELRYEESRRMDRLWSEEVKRIRRLDPSYEDLRVTRRFPSQMLLMENYHRSREGSSLYWARGQLIGGGSWGKVYIGLLPTFGKIIAVKRVSTTTPWRQRPWKLSKHHPNIVQYLGDQSTESHLDVFLEYVPGVSIETWISNRARLDRETTRFFTRQIVNGLDFLHNHKIIHGALKAEKVFVGSNGLCKLSDFGLKKFSYVKRHDHDLSGTRLENDIYWMAPEYIYGSSFFNFDKFTFKVDIWGLGCVVYGMWTGRRPWADMNPNAVKKVLRTRMEAPPLPQDALIDEEGRDFTDLCFIGDPEVRASASQLMSHPYLQLPAEWLFDSASISSESRDHSALSFDNQDVFVPQDAEVSLEAKSHSLFQQAPDITAETPFLGRPRLVEIYGQLGQFFPDHDLDRPINQDPLTGLPDDRLLNKTIRSLAAERAMVEKTENENTPLWSSTYYRYGEKHSEETWWSSLEELIPDADHFSASE